MTFLMSPGFLTRGEGSIKILEEKLILKHFQTGWEQEILAIFWESHVSQDCEIKRSQAFSKVWALPPSALQGEEGRHRTLWYTWLTRSKKSRQPLRSSRASWDIWIWRLVFHTLTLLNGSVDMQGWLVPRKEPSCLVSGFQEIKNLKVIFTRLKFPET